MSKYGVFPGPYFPAFRLNTERYGISLRIQSECGKIWTRKNSVFGHFSRSECYSSNQEEVEEETVLKKASFLMALQETRKNLVIGRISLNTTHSKHVVVEEKQRELAKKTQTQIQNQTQPTKTLHS